MNPAMRTYALSWALYQQAEDKLVEAQDQCHKLRAIAEEKWRECVQLPDGVYRVEGDQVVVKSDESWMPIVRPVL